MEGKIVRISSKNKDKFRETGYVGLPKMEISEASVSFSGVADDYNDFRFKSKQNTPDRAVLIMTTDALNQLATEGWPVQPGDIGENFTVEGIEYNTFAIGKKYLIGEVKVQISEVCNPCTRLAHLPYVGEEMVDEFIKTMKNRRGWYARVLEEGKVRTGDTITEVE